MLSVLKLRWLTCKIKHFIVFLCASHRVFPRTFVIRCCDRQNLLYSSLRRPVPRVSSRPFMGLFGEKANTRGMGT